MASISQCEYDIRRYKILKNELNSVISKLSLSIASTSDVTDEIKTKYQINDDVTPIVYRTKQLKEDITSTYNYLNNKVLPAIDLAINRLNKDISCLKEKEIEEKKKRKLEQKKG